MKQYTKQCSACDRTLHKHAIMCHCGQTVTLHGRFQGDNYELIGEVPTDLIFPLVDENAEIGSCGKITPVTIPFNDTQVRIRIRNSFAVFKRQPYCVHCEAKADKWLIVRRDIDLRRSCSLVLVTKDYIPLTIDHIVPKSQNGKNSMDNLQTMCFVCNNDKGQLSWDEYKKLHKGINYDFGIQAG